MEPVKTNGIFILGETKYDRKRVQRIIHKGIHPGGRLILRDYTGNSLLLWLCNHIEMPLAHLCGHGDVAMRSEKEIRAWCQNTGLKVESFEQRKGMRMHCVVRK